MKTLHTIAELRPLLDGERAERRSVGLVPTMGYLHDGHLALMRRARAETDVVVASIFVNPLQFGAGEDLEAYPSDLDRDGRLAEAAGVDVLFVPSADEMFPERVLTTV
ncbi:MAG TPA: pantoate--beta-alanine ligase, partial [Acidimicrobiales bacterium]